MRKLLRLLLLLAASPFLLALQFTAPQDGAQYTGNSVLVNYTWDESPVTFSITGQADQELNATATSVTLSPGTYIATVTSNISNNTSSDTVTVTVSAPVSQNLTVSTDAQTYEILSAARIRVTVTTPSQLSLVVTRDGQQIDSYTLNVQQQTDFLYTVQTVGNYVVTVSDQSTSAATQFVAQNTTLGVQISGSSTATTGRIISYASVVSGGAAPYIYNWHFSDNTTSNQANADHVFSQSGTYNITLLLTDSQNRQASASKSVTVSDETYRLVVTVMGNNNRLLPGAIVSLTDNRSGGRSGTTDNFGEIKFKNLTASNYTLNVTYNDTAQSPVVRYNKTELVALTDDENRLVTLPVPDIATNANSSQNNTSSNTSAATLAAAQTESTVAQSEATATDESFKSAASFVSSEESKALEDHRSSRLSELQNRATSLSVSEEKQKMIALLGLQPVFDKAKTTIEYASSAEQIDSAFQTVPKDVTITTRDTNVLNFEDVDLDDSLDRFFTARGITDEDEQKKYSYSVKQILSNTTITAKRSVVRVLGYDGQIQSTYTVFTRTAVASEATSFVEFIPKQVAADASALHVDGSHEVLDPDPVVRFLSTSYTYYVGGEVTEEIEPSILPVPFELKEPPSLVGLVSSKLDLGVAGASGLIVVIIGAILGIAVVGNIALRRNNSSSSLASFTELGDLALSTLSQGNYETVAKYAKDLQAIHATLSADEQALTVDVMSYIAEAQTIHNFRSSVTALRGVIELQDVTGVSGAYERVMQHYEALSIDAQKREQALFTQINGELETFVTAGNSAQQ